MVEEDGGDREQCGRITSRNGQKYHIMTVSEWHKIENDGVHDSRPVEYRWHIMMMISRQPVGRPSFRHCVSHNFIKLLLLPQFLIDFSTASISGVVTEHNHHDRFNLLTYKTLRARQPVYLHSRFAALLPSPSPRSKNDNSLSVPRV